MPSKTQPKQSKATSAVPAQSTGTLAGKSGTYRRVALADLAEDPANSRLHNDANIDAIRSSLRVFGQVEPLVVQLSTRKIIGGNGRYKAMILEGWTEAEIFELDCDNMTAASLGIALNRTAELAEWDTDALDKLMREIQISDEDFAKMIADLAEDAGIVPPDFEPVGIDKQGRLDEKSPITCPHCKAEFVPK